MQDPDFDREPAFAGSSHIPAQVPLIIQVPKALTDSLKARSPALAPGAVSHHQRPSGLRPDTWPVLRLQTSVLNQLLNPSRLARIRDGETKYGADLFLDFVAVSAGGGQA